MDKLTVTGMRTERVRLPPLPVPIGVGRVSLSSVECVLVFLDTDKGLVGEGVLFAMMGAATLRQLVLELEPLVVGLRPGLSGQFTHEAIGQTRFLGVSGATTMALAGVDMALWDLRAKAAGLNVADLIGACRDRLPVYNSGGLWQRQDIDSLKAQAEDFLNAGFRAMKMRLGHAADEDSKRVRAVREVIGPDIPLMVDSNQRWSVKEAIRRGRMLEAFNLAWYEEPIHYANHPGEAEVRKALPMPLASGESEYGPEGALAMLQQGCVDVLMPDLQRMGGPTGFMKAAHVAEAFKIEVSSHLYHEMSLPLLACLPGASYLEYMPWFEPIYRQKLELDAEGRALTTDRPGWGFDLDLDAVARYRF